MKFCIYNYNGSKKEQIMFVNMVALSIAVLVLVGQVDTTGAYVGLGNHILKEGKVNLAAGSTVVATKEDIEQYKAKFSDACDVDFDSEGNIVLHYKSQGATKDKGCTVDLLTNMKNNIVFTTGLSHSAGLENCLTDINQNTLPFAYSLKNEEISQLHNGPIFGNGGCCEGTCVKRTGLEVSWELQEKRKISILVLNVNPIGVALIRYTGQELPIVEERREYPTVMITYQFPRYRISYPKKGNVSAKNSCVKNIHQNILPPITWEIASTRLNPRMNRLLVFHLLPQRASRIREFIGGDKYKIQGYPPQGPDCDDLNIKFSKRNYRLINVLSIPETTKPPTNDKSKPPSTSDSPPSISNNPTNNNQISSTLANDENNSTTSTPKDNSVNMTTTDQVTETSELGTSTAPASKGSSSSTSASTKTTPVITTMTTTTKSSSTVVGIVVIAVILIIIVIGISVYFVIRKKPDKKGKDAEGGDEAKGDGEEEDDKKEEDGKEKKEDEGEKSKDEEEDGEKSKEDDEEDDKKEVKGSESKTEGETKEVESLSPEEKRIEDEIY